MTVIRGIPTTTLARTLLDCAAVLSRPALARCLHEAEIQQILDVAAIDRQLQNTYGRRGAGTLSALIAAYGPQPAYEGLETLFASILPADLPPHKFNAYVGLYEVDVLFPAQRVIVELDDVRTHRTARAFQRDRAKDAALMAQGYLVLRFTDQRLKTDAPAVLRELRAVLAQRTGSFQLRSASSN